MCRFKRRCSVASVLLASNVANDSTCIVLHVFAAPVIYRQVHPRCLWLLAVPVALNLNPLPASIGGRRLKHFSDLEVAANDSSSDPAIGDQDASATISRCLPVNRHGVLVRVRNIRPDCPIFGCQFFAPARRQPRIVSNASQIDKLFYQFSEVCRIFASHRICSSFGQ